jgi:hypothetical protein
LDSSHKNLWSASPAKKMESRNETINDIKDSDEDKRLMEIINSQQSATERTQTIGIRIN